MGGILEKGILETLVMVAGDALEEGITADYGGVQDSINQGSLVNSQNSTLQW